MPSRLTFVCALRNPRGGDSRLVFSVQPHIFVVVKFFGGAAVNTVKIWDTSGSSLEQVINHWRTDEPYTPSELEKADARRVIRTLVSQISG